MYHCTVYIECEKLDETVVTTRNSPKMSIKKQHIHTHSRKYFLLHLLLAMLYTSDARFRGDVAAAMAETIAVCVRFVHVCMLVYVVVYADT